MFLNSEMRESLNSETPIFDLTTNLGGTGVNHTCQSINRVTSNYVFNPFNNLVLGLELNFFLSWNENLLIDLIINK